MTAAYIDSENCYVLTCNQCGQQIRTGSRCLNDALRFGKKHGWIDYIDDRTIKLTNVCETCNSGKQND